MTARVSYAACVALFVGVWLLAQAQPSAADATYDSWLRHRDALLKDPTLIRYYTFEQGSGDQGDLVPNLVGDEAALTRGLARQPDEPAQKIEGRWPQKQAVRLDRVFLYAPPFEVTDKQFTVEAWVRVNGPGSAPGDTPSQTGTLLSVGIGFWDGWRVTMTYPERLIGFEMGRPQPINAFAIRTGRAPDRVWRHLVALWDGQ